MLDVDWREPTARAMALRTLLGQFERLHSWLERRFDEDSLKRRPLSDHIETVQRIIEQDTEPDPDLPEDDEARRLRQGVTTDRLISLSDRDQRHGRKSTTKAFNGYKRHISVDADVQQLICAASVQPANNREYDAAQPLIKQLEDNGYILDELHMDRGYLPAEAIVEKHDAGVKVISKPPTLVRTEYFAKDQFAVDFENETVTCPANVVVPLRVGTVKFPRSKCQACELLDRCTKAKSGHRSLSIHPQENWYREMSDELATKEGRELRRERIPVEHTLARVSEIQGNRARFRGLEKNQFDLERTAVVNNCYVLDRLWAAAA